MWKKDDPENPRDEKDDQVERSAAPPPGRGSSGRDPATIGPSITITGEVSGDEDLLIQGRVDGSVDLKKQSVTVGPEGKVKADITGRVVTVEGEVDGDLRGGEQVILRSSARVEGDITAPRVILEDGARFRGLVDMGEPSDEKERGRSGSSSGSSRRPQDSSASSSSSSSGEDPSGSAGSSGGDGDGTRAASMESAGS